MALSSHSGLTNMYIYRERELKDQLYHGQRNEIDRYRDTQQKNILLWVGKNVCQLSNFGQENLGQQQLEQFGQVEVTAAVPTQYYVQ